jgi:hypothetical protein
MVSTAFFSTITIISYTHHSYIFAFLLTITQAHFEDHPMDLEYLRHDKPLHPTRIQSHMKYVPSYLLPGGRRKGIASGNVNPSNQSGGKPTALVGISNANASRTNEDLGGDEDGRLSTRYDGAIAAGVLGTRE